VVAVGGQYKSGAMWKPLPDQTTKESRVAALRNLREEAAKAKSIIVAGAGPTGVEVAGELKAAFPDTTITMVGSLLPGFPKKQQLRMKNALERMGVIVREGRVDVDTPDAEGNVITREGDTISSVDLVLNAAGYSFAGAEIADEALKSNLNDRGQFKCRQTLQLQDCDTVFACGDIVAVPEGCFADVKGVKHAEETAKTVAKNVVLCLQKKETLENFAWSKKPILKPMITALGPKVAVAFMGLPSFLENFMGRKIKCQSYYMNMHGKDYGKGITW